MSVVRKIRQRWQEQVGVRLPSRKEVNVEGTKVGRAWDAGPLQESGMWKGMGMSTGWGIEDLGHMEQEDFGEFPMNDEEQTGLLPIGQTCARTHTHARAHPTCIPAHTHLHKHSTHIHNGTHTYTALRGASSRTRQI